MPTTTTTTPQDPPQQQQQRIPNPRRLLILSPSSHSLSTIPPFLLALTGSPVLETPSQSQSTSPSPSTDKPPKPSFAGYTTHPPLQIRNRYYVAEVPVWVDEIALEGQTESGTGAQPEPESGSEPITTPSLWKSEFSGPEAQVVRDAIGAVVICIVNPSSNQNPALAQAANSTLESRLEPNVPSGAESGVEAQTQSVKEFLRAVGEVRALIEEERGGMGDVPGLVVLVDQGRGQGQPATAQKQKQDQGQGLDDLDDADEEPFSIPWWEDQLYDMGLIGMEVVRWDAKGGKEAETEERNQFGEYQGMRRIREVLETHDWAPSLSSEDKDDADAEADEIEKMLLGDDGDEDEDTGFGLEVNELEREMAGLRFAIERGGSREEDSQEEGDEEMRVDAVEALLLRMAAIRDMSDELPEHERKRFAAKAVRDIMKEI